MKPKILEILKSKVMIIIILLLSCSLGVSIFLYIDLKNKYESNGISQLTSKPKSNSKSVVADTVVVPPQPSVTYTDVSNSVADELYATPEAAIVPSLFKEEIPPPWNDSCIKWLIEDAKDVAAQAPSSEDYFFFSLNKIYGGNPPENPVINFYKTKDFSQSPAFVLDKQGLKEKEKLICKWSIEYDEKTLAKNYLPDCLKDKHQFLGFIAYEEDEDNFRYRTICPVVNVAEFEKKEAGVFNYKVQIGDQKYFMDSSLMPGLANGNLLSTHEKRRRNEFETRSNTVTELAKAILDLKESKSFQELYECFVAKNKPCIMKFMSSDFIKIVGSSGSPSTCNFHDDDIKECLEKNKEMILDAAFYYVKDFIDAVHLLRLNGSELVKRGEVTELVVVPLDTHKAMRYAKTTVELSNNKMQFTSFNDGYVE